MRLHRVRRDVLLLCDLAQRGVATQGAQHDALALRQLLLDEDPGGGEPLSHPIGEVRARPDRRPGREQPRHDGSRFGDAAHMVLRLREGEGGRERQLRPIRLPVVHVELGFHQPRVDHRRRKQTRGRPLQHRRQRTPGDAVPAVVHGGDRAEHEHIPRISERALHVGDETVAERRLPQPVEGMDGEGRHHGVPVRRKRQIITGGQGVQEPHGRLAGIRGPVRLEQPAHPLQAPRDRGLSAVGDHPRRRVQGLRLVDGLHALVGCPETPDPRHLEEGIVRLVELVPAVLESGSRDDGVAEPPAEQHAGGEDSFGLQLRRARPDRSREISRESRGRLRLIQPSDVELRRRGLQEGVGVELLLSAEAAEGGARPVERLGDPAPAQRGVEFDPVPPPTVDVGLPRVDGRHDHGGRRVPAGQLGRGDQHPHRRHRPQGSRQLRHHLPHRVRAAVQHELHPTAPQDAGRAGRLPTADRVPQREERLL
ncbi:hypothetical protein M4C64_14520, partial [Microbacterium sp. p3-SID337]